MQIFYCILCGFPICNYDVLIMLGRRTLIWLAEFRAIYSDLSGSFVSGVGCNHENTWNVPVDPKMRWDADDNDVEVLDELLVMGRIPWSGRYKNGFLLHDACWHLLQKAFLPSEIPLQRLIKVCQSLPFPRLMDCVSWDHNYGGLHRLNDINYYPWEDRLVDEVNDEEVLAHAEANPYNIPEVPNLLAMRLEHPTGLPLNTQVRDCFSRLPWEILEAIAINLPTNDALSLRCISPAFLPLFSSTIFWASKFKANGDRGFIFETWENRNDRDWMSLYRLTNRTYGSFGIQNRRRIWDLVRPLKNITSLRLAEDFKTANLDEKFPFLRWSRATGDVKDEEYEYPLNFPVGCRILGTHVAQIPNDLSKIGISIISFANTTYIVGIRLITEKSSEICLGFVSESKEVIREAAAFRGFVLAMGSRGIHALQIVSQDASLSEWIGYPNESPITQRLANFHFIAGLEVSFDGYKIVGLGILGEKSHPTIAQDESGGSSLRQTALWYPTIPESELFLNDASFTGENPSNTRYQPIIWIHFGGPGGCYLKNVTGISVHSEKGLYSLEVHYDTTCDLAGSSTLGRCEATDVQHFPIDGASGEVIEAVDVTRFYDVAANAYNFMDHGALDSIKMTTNRQRSFHFGASSKDDKLKSVEITPGTVVTGFYASQAYRLLNLGVISEIIEKRNI